MALYNTIYISSINSGNTELTSKLADLYDNQRN